MTNIFSSIGFLVVGFIIAIIFVIKWINTIWFPGSELIDKKNKKSNNIKNNK